MEDLTTTLFLLLYDREFRRDFQGLKENELPEDFATIDWAQFNAFADTIERKVFEGPAVGDKSLTQAFSKTLEKIATFGGDCRTNFLLSDYYAQFSDLNHAEDFLSLEEAFYLFVKENFPKYESEARHEFLQVHLQNLALHSTPGFHLNPLFISRLRNGFIAIDSYNSSPYLYACIEKQFISGTIEPEVARILKKYFFMNLNSSNIAEAIDADEQILIDEICAIGFIANLTQSILY
jgi:hypothetical protein